MIIFAAIAVLAAAPVPLTCGAVSRPGIAQLGDDGIWRGRAVDICRSVAAEQYGESAPIAFHSYDNVASLRTASKDRLAFLSREELALTNMHAGPVVAVDRQVLVVPNRSPVRTSRDIAGRAVCFIIGTRAEGALNAWSAATHVRIERLAFQEPLELRDAYDVGKCTAMAVDQAELFEEHASRTLDPLDENPIFVASADEDRQLHTALVAVVSAKRQEP